MHIYSYNIFYNCIDYKESNRKLFNSNATYYRVIGHMDAIQNMTDKELNKTSYLEIFKSTKGSIKKSINYINYTKHDHNVITNQRLSSAYTSFRDNLMKYENWENDFNPDSKTKFLNRSPPHRDK